MENSTSGMQMRKPRLSTKVFMCEVLFYRQSHATLKGVKVAFNAIVITNRFVFPTELVTFSVELSHNANAATVTDVML